MTARVHDVTERAGALFLFAVSVVLAVWCRERVGDVNATVVRREQQLERLVEWQRAGGADALDPRAFDGCFEGEELIVASAPGGSYVLLRPLAEGRAR